MSNLQNAKELMEQYPEETKGLSVIEVKQIWEAYSDDFAAGWLMTDDDLVRMTFARPHPTPDASDGDGE